jgi:hypothetical protein
MLQPTAGAVVRMIDLSVKEAARALVRSLSVSVRKS